MPVPRPSARQVPDLHSDLPRHDGDAYVEDGLDESRDSLLAAVGQPSPSRARSARPLPRVAYGIEGLACGLWCGLRGLDELDYPLHDWTAVITTCGRMCDQRRKINVSQVFAGQAVGVKQMDNHLWLVTFMHYDLGYFDDETCRLEPIDDPFGPRLLPMSPE